MNKHTATPDRTFTVATDDSLSELIFNARDRILFIAPGITEPVAVALAARLSDPKISITVILDSDPEVYRLGFGTPEGLTILKEQLGVNQIGLRCQPGIRIGVLVADDKTMIYSPIPQLIEAGSTSATKPNALFLGGNTATKLSEAAGATENTLPSDSEIGKKALTLQDVEAIKKNIDENPPEPFDLTQKARVFSSRLQYVEFTVEKYQLTRQTVPIAMKREVVKRLRQRRETSVLQRRSRWRLYAFGALSDATAIADSEPQALGEGFFVKGAVVRWRR